MTATTSAGTILSISASLPATEDQAGYEALSYTAIGEATDLGEFGRTYNIVSHLPLAERRTKKYKGSYDNGDPAVSLARDPSDAGQVIAQAALLSDLNYSIKVALSDGSEQYFLAKVTSYTTGVGGADSINTSTMTLAIDSDIVEVAA